MALTCFFDLHAFCAQSCWEGCQSPAPFHMHFRREVHGDAQKFSHRLQGITRPSRWEEWPEERGEKRAGKSTKSGSERPGAARPPCPLETPEGSNMLNSQRLWVPPDPLASPFISSITEIFISISGKLHPLCPNPPTLPHPTLMCTAVTGC